MELSSVLQLVVNNFHFVVIGTVFGLLTGVLPGIGSTVGLAILIPLTFPLDPPAAFVLLAAAVGGSNFGGSITAILLNTPGAAPNAATLLDGFPMTRKGESGRAIGASATASALGAMVGIVVLALSVPVMLKLVLLFSSPEIFWLGIWGLTFVAIVVRGNLTAGLISGSMGLLVGMHGRNLSTSTLRWNYDITTLNGGIGIVPAILGLFAIVEMIKLYSRNEAIDLSAEDGIANADTGGRWQGVRDVFIHRWVFLRASLIGVIIGMIPGVGGAAANFIAYFHVVHSSNDPESFGTGDVRGVIASEASNDAKDGGSFIPTIGLGVPGSTLMAIFFGAFVLHGMQPGPLMVVNHLDIVVLIIVALVLSNLLSSGIGLVLANKLALVTKMDIGYLAPTVITIAFIGAFASGNDPVLLYIALAFGILGYVMEQIDMSRVPLVLGIVLGPIVEENFIRSLEISRGDYGIFVSSPQSILLVLLIVIGPLLPHIRERMATWRGDS